MGSIPFPNASRPMLRLDEALFTPRAGAAVTTAEFNLSASLVCSGHSSLMTPFQTIYVISRLGTPASFASPTFDAAQSRRLRGSFVHWLRSALRQARTFGGQDFSSSEHSCSLAPSFADLGAAFQDAYILFATLLWLLPLGMLLVFSTLSYLKVRGYCACLSYHGLSRRPHSAS